MGWFNNISRSGSLVDFLVNLYQLRIYKSEKLLTKRVKAEQGAQAITLTLMMFIDSWAWYRAWSYGLVEQVLIPLVLGTSFAIAAVMYDRSVIVADTTTGKVNGYYQIGGRALLLILISFLTAVPVELAVFESEITKKLESQEKAAADLIRDKAIETVNVALNADVSELQAQLAGDASLTQGNADTDINRFQQDRARERTQMLQAQSAKRQLLVTTLKDKSDQVALEAAGQGPSGKYGNGPAFQAMKAQEQEARQALNTFESETASQNATFDQETKEHMVQLRAARDKTVSGNQANVAKALDAKRKERKQKIEELRVMSNDKLAALYGGEWRVAKGFLARFHVLAEMADTDSYVNHIVWGCRIVMILMGMFVLSLKLMASQEFKLYYSLAAQAKNGDEDAKAAVTTGGNTEFEQYGNSASVRSDLEELHSARKAVWLAIWELEKHLVALTKVDNKTGMFKTRVEIEGGLHAAWLENGAAAMGKVSEIEEHLRLIGVSVPNWPTKMGSDPRGTDPWKVTEGRLAGFGWHKPDQKLEEVKKAKTDLIAHRRELRKLIATTEFELHQLIRGEPTISKSEIDALRMNVWETTFVSLLDKMSDLEFFITELGQKTPEWPAEFEDPRPGLFERICKLEDRDLTTKYGWQG